MYFYRSLTCEPVVFTLQCDRTVLIVIFLHSIILTKDIITRKIFNKFFIVSNDNKLKVTLFSLSLNDSIQNKSVFDPQDGSQLPNDTLGQALNVFSVKIRRWFIQGEHTTINTKCLCKCKSDDDGRQHFLSCTASASHI